MNPEFDISIVISSYNRDDKVLQTIERLFESDLNDFNKMELIVIDDGSPNPVKEILPKLKDIPGKIDLKLITQENSGIGATRNRGFREANSEIIVFLDDDILLKKNTLKDIFEAQQEHEGAIIFGTYPFISHSSESLYRFASSFFGYDMITTEKKIEKTNGITSGLLSVNRTKLNGLENFYKDDLTIPAAEEHEIMFRFHKLGIPVFYARHIAAIHNHHLQLGWLARQQYKYGLATAEAFIKNPEILELEKFAEWKKSFTSSGRKRPKGFFNFLLTSWVGRRSLFFSSRILEKLFPRADHNFIFGLLVSAYFQAGYRDGLRRFSR